MHIQGMKLLFHHIPKMLYWVEILCLWGPFYYSKLIVMFKKPISNDSSFVTWCIILLEVGWWPLRDMDRNNVQVGRGI